MRITKKPFTVDIQHLLQKSFIYWKTVIPETGKSTLLPEAYPIIDELVAYLNRKDDEKIELGGHTR